jgi:hypothetical protein
MASIKGRREEKRENLYRHFFAKPGAMGISDAPQHRVVRVGARTD